MFRWASICGPLSSIRSCTHPATTSGPTATKPSSAVARTTNDTEIVYKRNANGNLIDYAGGDPVEGVVRQRDGVRAERDGLDIEHHIDGERLPGQPSRTVRRVDGSAISARKKRWDP